MNRVPALATIALLLVAAVVGFGSSPAVGSSSLEPVSVGSTVETNDLATDDSNASRTRLELPGEPHHENARLSLDVGTTLAIGDGQFETRYQQELDQRRIADADGDERLVSQFTDRIESRIDELRDRERAAVKAYAAGETSSREFARQLVLISAEATQLERQLSTLKDVTDERETALRIDSLTVRLQSRLGPVHETLEQDLNGEGTADVAVAATTEGYVLGWLDRSSDTYHRHAIRYDARNLGGDVTLATPNDGFERVRDLYPETDTNEVFITSARYANQAGLIRINVNYPEGPVTLYLDTASAEVFHEERRLDVEEMPRSTAINETTDGVRIVVERTFDNGPTLVKAFDAETDEPTGVTLAADGRDVGGTGGTGERWFVAPPGTYTLSVSDGDAQFNVTVPAE
ncbi:MAG: DUF7096 domain-containing protein [Halanaeroarchaeum sp.]